MSAFAANSARTANHLIFVGMAQLLSYTAPPLQATTRTLTAGAIVGQCRSMNLARCLLVAPSCQLRDAGMQTHSISTI